MQLTARTACVLSAFWLVPAFAAPDAASTCHAGFIATAQAGPLNREWVDKNASAVIHFDVEAAMQSTLGKYLLAHRDQIQLGPIDQIRQQTGFDPLTDLKSVTVYTTSDQPNERIRIIRATPALDAAIARMRQPDIMIQAITTGTWSLEAWSTDDWKRFGHVGAGTDESDRVLVFSCSQLATARALEVKAGRAPNLTQLDGGVMATKPPAGSILFVATDNVSSLIGDQNTASPVTKMAQSMVLNIGEQPSASSLGDADLCIDVALKTAGFSDAARLADLLRGALALGKQLTHGNPSWSDMNGLFDAFAFRSEGDSVIASCRWSSMTLVHAFESAKIKINADSPAGGTPTAPPWYAELCPLP